MLHAAIVCPGEPDKILLDSLRKIRLVKWEVVVDGSIGQFSRNLDDILNSQCNFVAVLDSNFTSFDFLSALVRNGCHLFLPGKQEMTSPERTNLIRLAEEGNTSIRIRNDLLVHPSLSEFNTKTYDAQLIDIKHFAPGKPYKLQEMMYDNLLMVLRMVDAEPSRMSVCSIPNSDYQPDVVNIHLNFNNGSAANLTLSFTDGKKEHLLSIHSTKGLIHCNLRDYNNYNSSFAGSIEKSLELEEELLLKQISIFSEAITRKNCHKEGLSAEARSFQLIEKINRKLELSLVLL